MASLKDEIDLLTRQSGYGSLSEATADATFGINHRGGAGNASSYNTDATGLTFFTRPNLNLAHDNLMMDRVLFNLAVVNENAERPTFQRAVRAMLDPQGAFESGITSPIVDTNSPFIAILTNRLLSLNGWPDPVVGYFDSKAGTYKETWSMIDDVAKNYGSFDLQASFRNTAGDPITLLFNSWIRYAARVYEGTMMPYPQSILENEIDYNTRIYRLVLDPSRQYVQKIASTIAFPTSSSLGAAMNFSSDTPFNQDNAQQIQIPFHCVGAEYQDSILIREFNDIVGLFNPNMSNARRAASGYVKLSQTELATFNYYGYPYIDPKNQNELQWWVKPDDYNAITSALKAAATTSTP
jgi:hypothetical protein